MDAIRAAVGDEKTDLPRLLLRHPARRHVRPAVPAARSGRWCWTARSTRSRTSSPAPRARPRASSGRSPTSPTWCKANARHSARSRPDARAAVTDALAKAAGLARSTGADGREATAGWIFLAVISSLYTESGWQELAKAIDNLQAGDPKGIFELADPYAERDAERQLLQPVRRQPRGELRRHRRRARPSTQVRKLQGEWRTKYPLFGAALAVGMLPCTFWPGAARPVPGRAGHRRAADRGGRHHRRPGDAVREHGRAGQDARRRAGAHLGGRGTHRLPAAPPCIIDAVDAYLIDLTVPQEGLRCPPQ